MFLLSLFVATNAFANEVAMKCEKTEQKGCLEIDILNAKWDETHPAMKDLDSPVASQDERYRRVTTLGGVVWKEFKAGKVRASGPRTFLVYMWNIDTKVSADHMSAYKQVGPTPSGLSKVALVDVTGKAPNPKVDPVSNLGLPAMVVQVKADDIGAALQFPWGMVTATTYILVCAEDRLSVYPNRITATEGLGLTPEYLNAAKGKAWNYMLVPFLSKDK